MDIDKFYNKRGNGNALDQYFGHKNHQDKIGKVQPNIRFAKNINFEKTREFRAEKYRTDTKSAQQAIQVHNFKIFNKIQGVLKNSNTISFNEQKGPKSLNAINRRHDFTHIDKGNTMLKNKIQSVSSNYS